MDSVLEVRSLGAGDLDPLLALYAQLHADDDPAPSRAELEALWHTILGNPAQLYVGGFVGETLVTTCNAIIVPNLTRGARPYAVIEQVVTHRDHRRRGYGETLMRHMLRCCWERRCYKVSLTSGMSRSDAHAFYEALGFSGNAKQAYVITAR